MQIHSAMYRILLVEDEALVATALSYVLEDAGYSVTIASDGREGLELAFEQQPNLIITDYMMPHMNGIDMIRRIRKAGITTPIILLTALSQRNFPTAVGYDLFLSKPYDERRLIESVKQLVSADPKM